MSLTSTSKLIASCSACYVAGEQPARDTPPKEAKCERCNAKPATRYVWMVASYAG